MKKLLIFIVISFLIASIFFLFFVKRDIYIKQNEKCKIFNIPEMEKICNAILSRNISICNLLANPFNYLCIDFYIEYVDVKIEDCNKIKYGRNLCFDKLAIMKNDLRFCENGTPEFCYLKFYVHKNDLNSCLSVCPDDRLMCIKKLVKSVEDCKILNDSHEKEYCYRLVLNKDPKEKCKMVYEITTPPTIIIDDECLFNYAIQTNNYAICELIEMDELKWKCFGYLNPKKCDQASLFWSEYCKLHNLFYKG